MTVLMILVHAKRRPHAAQRLKYRAEADDGRAMRLNFECTAPQSRIYWVSSESATAIGSVAFSQPSCLILAALLMRESFMYPNSGTVFTSIEAFYILRAKKLSSALTLSFCVNNLQVCMAHARTRKIGARDINPVTHISASLLFLFLFQLPTSIRSHGSFRSKDGVCYPTRQPFCVGHSLPFSFFSALTNAQRTPAPSSLSKRSSLTRSSTFRVAVMTYGTASWRNVSV